MEYRDEKFRLLEAIVNLGLDRADVKPGDAAAPPELLNRWLRNFYGPSECVRLSSSPRLLNRFSIGADPELVFKDEGRYMYAENLGMDTLAAFGADMSGRQAELRAKPSRFALDVVASLMEALRWMAATYPVNQLTWSAAPYIEDNAHRDGCGGHVHFGRKRSTIQKEIAQLDIANHLLLYSGVFDRALNNQRVVNTRRMGLQGGYGSTGDYRVQSYGYEYRTFPTWLSDPWSAYLAIVVSKLLVLHNGRLQLEPKRATQQIKNLLCFYRGLDDDAAIAWKAMEVLGMPQAKKDDIKAAWGVRNAPPIYLAETTYIPPSIVPEDRTRQELFDRLTTGKAIPQRSPEPTWAPLQLPPTFFRVRVQAHVMNIPDIAMGLVSKNVAVSILGGGHVEFKTPIRLNERVIRARLSALVHPNGIHFSPSGRNAMTVSVPRGLADSQVSLHEFKTLLRDSTLFPVCHVDDINKVDWNRWDKQESYQVAEKTALGRQIATIDGQ